MEIRKLALKEKYKKWTRGQQVFPKPSDNESEHAYILKHQEEYISYYEDSILEKSGLLRSSLLVTSRRPVHPLLFLFPSLYFSISVPPKLRAFFRASYSTVDFLWLELLFRKTRSRRSKRER